jgi:hypothetical protein
MTAIIAKRFVELGGQLEEILASKVQRTGALTGSTVDYIDSDLILNWSVKVKSLFERLGAEASSQLQMFIQAEKHLHMETHANRLKRLRAIFLATKEDFEGGHLVSYRNLVQAEVFSNELEQAEELFGNGYATAAAVIAGVVLETALRDLCTARGINHGSMNRMNDDLTKAGAYNANQQKQIVSLAAIRNSAAHGKPEEFTKDQVRGMIDDVQRFLTAHL